MVTDPTKMTLLIGYDLRTPGSNVGKVLVFVASSDMLCAAFGAIDEHVVVAVYLMYPIC